MPGLTHPTATARHSRLILLVAALVAVVVAPGATVTSGDNGSSTPTPPAFHLPPYALMHGGAPVPDISVAALPHGRLRELLQKYHRLSE